jgi:ABC-type transport system involved in multi-copper enzyme maturation permease subunit
MLFVATILMLAAGIFFGAGNNNAPWANQVCSYGSAFCQHPSWLGIAALLSLIWAMFLRVDRL